MKKLQTKSFRPSIESLEERQMLAGDVSTVHTSNHSLIIWEHIRQPGQANAIEISQQSRTGAIVVKGIRNLDGGTTRVDGSAQQIFHGVAVLDIRLGDGRDLVKLMPNTKLNHVRINVASRSSESSTVGDVVTVDRVTTRGSMTIDTGAGADWVSVLGSRIGNHPLHNLTIRTGAGKDTVAVQNLDYHTYVRGNLNVNTYGSPTEADRDVVSLRHLVVSRTLNVNQGGGDDTLQATGIYAENDILFSAGDGSDQMTLTSVRAGDDFWVFMEEGNDALTANGLRADELTLDGGAGSWDYLFQTGKESRARLFSLSEWEPHVIVNRIPVGPIGVGRA